MEPQMKEENELPIMRAEDAYKYMECEQNGTIQHKKIMEKLQRESTN